MAVTTTTVAVKPQIGPPWSFSHLKNVESCPRRYYHYQVAKDVQEPESAELREGNRLHAAFENRLKSAAPLPLGYRQFEPMLARIAASPGTLYTEQKLAITGRFEPCSWMSKSVWFRSVSDCAVHAGERMTVFDWKTGKPPRAYGDADHTQLQLMAATFFAHMPEVERVRAALVYVHHDATSQAEFTRADQAEIWGEILPRVNELQRMRMQNAFPPKPGGLCRRYCAVSSCPYFQKGA